MENISGAMIKRGDHIELPPGFRFHPTDEELISNYLLKKVFDCNFSAVAIGEVDMNKVEPWELPCGAKLGENEWYFFCIRDRKYPTGLRTNRATSEGYWKATGKDKEIFRGKTLVGMKKTLVFYKGRAPKGEKSNWVNHEYRLEGKLSLHNLPKSAKNEWVISRVFHKTSGGKKVHISELMRRTDSQSLPPLLDASGDHVYCFSSSTVDPQGYLIPCFNTTSMDNSVPADSFSGVQFPGMGLSASVFRNYGLKTNQGIRDETEMVCQETEKYSSGLSTFETGKRLFQKNEEDHPLGSVGSLDLDCIWSY